MNLRTRDNALYAALVCVALGLGIYIHWPSIDSGLRSDDYPQRAMLRGEFPVPRSPLDLFDFASGDPRDVEALMDFGYMPWWTVPNLRLRMWRPLASGLMALEQSVLHASPEQQHLHSLAWYAFLVCVAAHVFRRWLTLPAAAAATLLFAIEEGHTVPVGWLANRNTLAATALGLLTLDLHARAREVAAATPLAFSLRALATAACASLALLSGEYAFTALAYVAAYECLRPEPILVRVRRSLPVLLPAAGYLLLHSWIGSDIVGSGFYLSPLREPLAYASAAVLRVPSLFADLSLGLPADWFNGQGPLRNYFLQRGWFSPQVWRRLPGWPVWNALIGCGGLVLSVALLRLCLARVPETSRRPLQVLALGSLLSLLPAAGSLPGDRLILAAAFGISGLFGSLLVYARPTRSQLAFGSVAAWAFVLATAGPLTFRRSYNQAGGFAWTAEGMRIWSKAAELPSPEQSPQTRVYVLATADFTTAVNLPWLRLHEGFPLPLSYRRLCPAVAPIDVRRTGERTLEIMVLSSEIRYSAQPSLYRGESAPILQNQMVRMPGLDVTVLLAREGNPVIMRFDFDRPLEDPQLWFVESTSEGLKRFHPPKVGETKRVIRPIYRDLRVPLES
ncbi:MAG TPA: hypothetical protein VJV78_06660 [Polyangiales bacterium]|nr:hypothetical protein [Polyangiales bacterium]